MINFTDKFIEKIKSHVLCSVTFYAVCEIMGKICLGPGWPQMTVWRMHITGWTPKATNIHSE